MILSVQIEDFSGLEDKINFQEHSSDKYGQEEVLLATGLVIMLMMK